MSAGACWRLFPRRGNYRDGVALERIWAFSGAQIHLELSWVNENCMYLRQPCRQRAPRAATSDTCPDPWHQIKLALRWVKVGARLLVTAGKTSVKTLGEKAWDNSLQHRWHQATQLEHGNALAYTETRQLTILWTTRQVKTLWTTRQLKILWTTRQVKLLWTTRQVRILWTTRQVKILWITRQVKLLWTTQLLSTLTVLSLSCGQGALSHVRTVGPVGAVSVNWTLNSVLPWKLP